MKHLTWEQIIRIVAEGSTDLALHDGRCEVLEAFHKAAIDCEKEGEPWVLTGEQVRLFAAERFEIDIKKSK